MMPKISKNCRKPRARKPAEALTSLGVPFIQEGISLFFSLRHLSSVIVIKY